MTSPVIVDVFSNDLNGHPDIPALVTQGLPFAGVCLKATEGTYYPSTNALAAWFRTYWPKARDAGGDRVGKTWFRWAYHYYRVGEDPIKQADFYLKLVESAGGFKPGDLPPMIDVETAENPPNGPASQVVDEVSRLAGIFEAKLGRKPILYAGSYIRDLKIVSHMGCAYLITAAYGSDLPGGLYRGMGWSLDLLLGWQYQGTEAYTGPINYPRDCALGKGPLDLTAVTIGNGQTQEQQLAILASYAIA